ncbi:MAG: transposase [Tannerellaceae bacterium]|nr:transposase [Tannerellaceae bacterium]
MSTGYKIDDQEALHYVTFQVVHWIDIFTRKEYRDIIIDSLNYCQQHKGLEVYGYVIMSNHIHLLLKSEVGLISSTLRDLKSFTTKQMLQFMQTEQESRRKWMLNLFAFSATSHKRNRQYQIWIHENHAEEIYSLKFIRQKLDYIHNNPVRAGIVEHPEDFLYLSARNYSGLPAVLDIELLYLNAGWNRSSNFRK